MSLTQNTTKGIFSKIENILIIVSKAIYLIIYPFFIHPIKLFFGSERTMAKLEDSSPQYRELLKATIIDDKINLAKYVGLELAVFSSVLYYAYKNKSGKEIELSIARYTGVLSHVFGLLQFLFLSPKLKSDQTISFEKHDSLVLNINTEPKIEEILKMKKNLDYYMAVKNVSGTLSFLGASFINYFKSSKNSLSIIDAFMTGLTGKILHEALLALFAFNRIDYNYFQEEAALIERALINDEIILMPAKTIALIEVQSTNEAILDKSQLSGEVSSYEV